MTFPAAPFGRMAMIKAVQSLRETGLMAGKRRTLPRFVNFLPQAIPALQFTLAPVAPPMARRSRFCGPAGEKIKDPLDAGGAPG